MLGEPVKIQENCSELSLHQEWKLELACLVQGAQVGGKGTDFST